MGPLKHGGLALATSIAAVFNVVVLIHLLRKRVGSMGGRKILSSVIKLFLVSGVMGIAVYYFNAHFLTLMPTSILKLLILSIDIAIGVLIYAILSRIIQNEEFSFLIELTRKRKKKSFIQ